MASLNKVFLIGNLGADPEKRVTDRGNSVCSFSVSTTDKWTDRQGNPQEKTEWHNCFGFDRIADLVIEYCKRGTTVHVEGSLTTTKWEGQDGNIKSKVEIKVFKILWLKDIKTKEDHEPDSRVFIPADMKQTPF